MTSESRDAFGAERSSTRRWWPALAALLSVGVGAAVMTLVLVGQPGLPALLESDVPGYHPLAAGTALSVAATHAMECAGVSDSRSRAFTRTANLGDEGMQSQAAATSSPAAAAAALAPLRRANAKACMRSALERIAATSVSGRVAPGLATVTREAFVLAGASNATELTAVATNGSTTDYLALRGFTVGRTIFTLMTFSLAHGFPTILADQLAEVLVRRATTPANHTGPTPTKPPPAGGLAAAIGVDQVAEGIAAQAQSAAADYADAHRGSFTGMTPATLRAAAGTDAVPVASNAGMPYVSAVRATAATYAITVSDPANTSLETFTVHRAANATITHTCTPAHGTDGACLDGTW